MQININKTVHLKGQGIENLEKVFCISKVTQIIKKWPTNCVPCITKN